MSARTTVSPASPTTSAEIRRRPSTGIDAPTTAVDRAGAAGLADRVEPRVVLGDVAPLRLARDRLEVVAAEEELGEDDDGCAVLSGGADQPHRRLDISLDLGGHGDGLGGGDPEQHHRSMLRDGRNVVGSRETVRAHRL